MNESANLMSMAMVALSQLQNVKDKMDPEVFELLNKSGHEAIASAHHFLEACEKALDSITESVVQDEINLSEEDDAEKNTEDNVVTFTSREA